jgi:hypothetical protein
MGGRKPAKASAARVTLNEQEEAWPLASVAVQMTVVVPTGNPDPGGTE